MAETIGMLAAIFGTIAMFPQVFKTIKTRNTEGLSLLMYSFWVTAVLLWLIYGLMINDTPLIVANTISFFSTVVILGMIIFNKFFKKK